MRTLGTSDTLMFPARSPQASRSPDSTTIELRSDTMTSPTDDMYAAFRHHPTLGDDAWGTDTVVEALEARCAELFGKESAVYTASGTMGNQLAIASQLQPGDELVTEYQYHVNYFESAATVTNTGAVLHPVVTCDGVLRVHDLDTAIARKPRGPNYAAPRLLCVENTIGTIGGVVYPFHELQDLYGAAHDHGMNVHLDGARIVNASVATGIDLIEYGSVADTVSMCFSKGLSAPFGGILVGDSDVMDRARRKRKWLGGALHQASFTAAAAMTALDRRGEVAADHAKARDFHTVLSGYRHDHLKISEPQTNIVLIDVDESGAPTAEQFVSRAADIGVQLSVWRPGQIRAVLHRGVSRGEAIEAAHRLGGIDAA